MDVVNPANMPSILNDADHPFVPSINIPGYNIEKIDTTLSANLTYPNSDYIGNKTPATATTAILLTLLNFSSLRRNSETL